MTAGHGDWRRLGTGLPGWGASLLLAALLAIAGGAGACGDGSRIDSDDAEEDDGRDAEHGNRSRAAAKVAEIVLAGFLPETEDPFAFLGAGRKSLRHVVERIEAAGGDDDIGAILIVVRPLAIGWGRALELRAAVERAGESGKPVYAYLEAGRDLDYVVACGAGEILMPPAGELMLTGLHAEALYLRDLLTAVGVEADFEAVGRYKSAAESLTRSEPSEAARESMESLIDDIYRAEVEAIASSRRLTPEKVRAAIDAGPYRAADAVTAGLIDRVVYPAEVEAAVAGKVGAGEGATLVHNYGAGKSAADMNNPMALVRALLRPPRPARSGRPIVALVHINGAILHGEDSGRSLFGGGTYSTELLRALDEIAEDDDIKAVVLRVDSPGGSANASDLIHEAIRLLDGDKPVIASMGDVAASGGYYVAVGARHIFANAATITGSIGVVGGKLVFGDAFRKYGVGTWSVSRGRHAGIMSSVRPFSDGERAAIRKHMEGVYELFVSKVAASRERDPAEIRKVAEGRISSGTAALAAGLVDEIGDLHDAIEAAGRSAELVDFDVIVAHPRPKGLAEVLAGEVRAQSGLGPFFAELEAVFLPGSAALARGWVAILPALAGERVLAVAPLLPVLR